MALDGSVPSVQRQRVKHMLRDLADGAFVVLAFPDESSDQVRIYASGLSVDKMRRIESFVRNVINGTEESDGKDT